MRHSSGSFIASAYVSRPAHRDVAPGFHLLGAFNPDPSWCSIDLRKVLRRISTHHLWAPPQQDSTRYLMVIVPRSARNLISVQWQPVPARLEVAPIKVETN